MTPSHSTLNTSELEEAACRWFGENVSVGSLAEAEQTIEEISRRLKQAMMAQVAERSGRSATHQGASRECTCGGVARFVGYRSRWVVTLCGAVRVERAYYHCASCGTGLLPWDAAEGLDGQAWSPGVKALGAEVCGRLHYGEASALIERFTGIKIAVSSLEQIVAEVGGRLQAKEDTRVAALLEGTLALAPRREPTRLYISADGTMAHTDGGWHEVKTGLVYEGVPTGKGKHPDWDRKEGGRYIARQENSEELGKRLYCLAVESGLAQAGEVIVVGDGAAWIWAEADLHFGGRKGGYTGIVDYWHVCERIHSLARVLYGDGNATGQRWAKQHCDGLEEKGPAGFLRALRRRKTKGKEQREAVAEQRGFFERNRQRMDYPSYRGRGLMIGSGPMEAGCKVVVGQRCKGAGMRWTAKGCNAVLAVRTALLNGDLDEIGYAARAA